MAITKIALDGSNVGIQLTAPDLSADVLSLDVVSGALTSSYISADNLVALKPVVGELFALVPQAQRAAGALGLLSRLCAVVAADTATVTLSAVNTAGNVYALRATVAAAPANLVAHVTTSIDGGMNAAGGGGGGGGAPVGPAGGDLSGNYPNPDVAGLGGDALPANAADGFLKRNAANNAWEEVAYGNAANTVCEGDDARLSDSRPPNGASGGVLGYPGSTYPNPTGLSGFPVGLPIPVPSFGIPVPPNANEAYVLYGGDVTGTPGQVAGVVGIVGGNPTAPAMNGGVIVAIAGPGSASDNVFSGGRGGEMFYTAGSGGDGAALGAAGDGGSFAIIAGSAGIDNGAGGARGGRVGIYAGKDSDGSMSGISLMLGGGSAGRASSGWTILGCSGNRDPYNEQAARAPSPVMAHGPILLETMNDADPTLNIGDLLDASSQIDVNLVSAGTSFVYVKNISGAPLDLNTPPASGTITKPEVATDPALTMFDRPRLLIIESVSNNAITFNGEATVAGTNLLLVGGTATLSNGGRLTLLWSPLKSKWIELSRAVNPT